MWSKGGVKHADIRKVGKGTQYVKCLNGRGGVIQWLVDLLARFLFYAFDLHIIHDIAEADNIHLLRKGKYQ